MISREEITVGHWQKTKASIDWPLIFAPLTSHFTHQGSRRGKFASAHVQFNSAETLKAQQHHGLALLIPIEKSHPVVCSPWHDSTIKARTLSAVMFLLPAQ